MARTEAQNKYDKANMAYQTVKVKRELLDSFKAACAANGHRVNTVLREAMQAYVNSHEDIKHNKPRLSKKTGEQKESRWSKKTGEQKQRYYEYLRNYRANNRDKVKEWRENYIIRKAERLMTEKAVSKEE